MVLRGPRNIQKGLVQAAKVYLFRTLLRHANRLIVFYKIRFSLWFFCSVPFCVTTVSWLISSRSDILYDFTVPFKVFWHSFCQYLRGFVFLRLYDQLYFTAQSFLFRFDWVTFIIGKICKYFGKINLWLSLTNFFCMSISTRNFISGPATETSGHET